MGTCLLPVSPIDRAWSQGLAKTLVLELAPNQTHDWLSSHKASSQIRWLAITLFSIVRPRVRGMHFFSPPQVCLPPHVELTPSNNVSHYFSAWWIRFSMEHKDFDRALMLDIYQISLSSSHCNVNEWQRVTVVVAVVTSTFATVLLLLCVHRMYPIKRSSFTLLFPFHTSLHYTMDKRRLWHVALAIMVKLV